jgi:hypothetical protein
MTQPQQQFNKHDDAKPRWSGLVRLPGQNALLRTIARNDHGAAQYGMHNWHNVPSLDRYHDALLRHAFALIRGETTDEADTQFGPIHHDDAVVWNALALSELMEMRRNGST